MNATVSPADMPESQPAGSAAARLLGAIISPGRTFASVARRPDFLLPLLLLVISSVAVTETMLAKIGMERIVRAQMERSSRAGSMSPEQMDAAVRQGAKIGAIIAHIGGFVGIPIVILIVAAIGLGLSNFVFGAPTGFKTAFSVTCYAYLPGILGGLMGLASVLFGDPEHFNPQTPIPSNMGFFLDAESTPKPLYSLASSFDIFSLWYLVLLGIGFSAASGGKAKARSMFLAFFGLWMILVLGKMGLAAIF